MGGVCKGFKILARVTLKCYKLRLMGDSSIAQKAKLLLQMQTVKVT